MKKSKMVLKMTRFYSSQHVMLESGYITLREFMTKLLEMQEEEGMVPPDTDNFVDADISVPVFDDGEIVDRIQHGWDKE